MSVSTSSELNSGWKVHLTLSISTGDREVEKREMMEVFLIRLLDRERVKTITTKH